MTASNGRKPKRCRPRIAKVTAPVISAAAKRSIPSSRWNPQPDRGLAREALAADFRQVPAGGDAELRRQRLDKHRHQVRGDDHPDEREAELRAARDVRGEVAGIHVRDARDERRPQEREDPEWMRSTAKNAFGGADRLGGSDRVCTRGHHAAQCS
jgi:hypothetical protein